MTEFQKGYKRGREEMRQEMLKKVLAFVPEESTDFQYLTQDFREFARQIRSMLEKELVVPLTPEKGEEKLGGAGKAENVFYNGNNHCESCGAEKPPKD